MMSNSKKPMIKTVDCSYTTQYLTFLLLRKLSKKAMKAFIQEHTQNQPKIAIVLIITNFIENYA